MPLYVRTANGRMFRRAGLEFGAEPVEVADDVLKQELGPPSYPRGTTVRQVIEAERMLVCAPGSKAGREK